MIEDDVVKLRALEPSDVDILYRWENDMEIWQLSNTITPFSRNILQQYIENAHLDIYQVKQLRLMIDAKIKDKTMTAGCIDLFDFDPYHQRAGIGILIHDKQHREQGYASHALNLLIRYSFATLDLHQLYCNITTENTVSLKLFKNAGFTIIGKKKDWTKTPSGWSNEYLLQLIKDVNF